MSGGLVQTWKDTVSVERSLDDGFIDATQMSRHFNKRFVDYARSVAGSSYMKALQSAIGESSPIVNSTRGCSGQTWIHPRLAIDFARWLDVEFAVWMDGWILKIVDTRPSQEQAEPPSETRLFRNQLVIMNESDLHCHIVAETRKAWPDAVLVPGIGELPEAGAKRLQAWKMGYTKGQPDLMILNPSGEHLGLAIEFKHPGFEPAPSDDQLTFHARLRALGWNVLVCNDLLAGMRQIDSYMRMCKVPCDCCNRLFLSRKHVDSHLLRKRKHEESEDRARAAALELAEVAEEVAPQRMLAT